MGSRAKTASVAFRLPSSLAAPEVRVLTPSTYWKYFNVNVDNPSLRRNKTISLFFSLPKNFIKQNTSGDGKKHNNTKNCQV